MKFKNNVSVQDYKTFFDVKKDVILDSIFVENTDLPNGLSFIGPSEYKGEIHFLNCKIKSVKTYVNHFKELVRFENCEIDEVELFGQFYDKFIMRNCVINGCFKITDTVFHKEVILHKNDFLGGTNIWQCAKSNAKLTRGSSLVFNI